MATTKTKAFRDPVHDLIYFGPEDQWILELIDTKEFQRLRRIRQLGLSHFTYPGAEHSRFVHSLGVFNFARRMLEILKARQPGLAEEIDTHAPNIKAAALLHDIGHGPFSHVFERVFAESVAHETRTCEILLSDDTQVGKKLTELHSSVEGLDRNSIAGLIAEGSNRSFPQVKGPAEPFLKQIVSSQLDADRMDYLLRDGLMTGSRYGQFDSEWILNNLDVGEIDWNGATKKTLCLDARKGTGAIVGLLFARILMLEYVYYHKTTRAYEAELVSALRLAAELVEKLPSDTPPHVREVLEKRGAVDEKTYLMLDDETLWWALRQWATWKDIPNGEHRERAEALRHHVLRLVRRMKPWRSYDLDRKKSFEMLAWERKLDSGDPIRHVFYLDQMSKLPYKDLRYLASKTSDDPAETFFSEIFVRSKDGSLKPFSELSPPTLGPMIQALSQNETVVRLHVDQELCNNSKELVGFLHSFGVC